MQPFPGQPVATISFPDWLEARSEAVADEARVLERERGPGADTRDLWASAEALHAAAEDARRLCSTPADDAADVVPPEACPEAPQNAP
jgi:hypothetical protein